MVGTSPGVGKPGPPGVVLLIRFLLQSEACGHSCNWSGGESSGRCCDGSFPESGREGLEVRLSLTSGADNKTPSKGVQLTDVHDNHNFLPTTIALATRSPPLS